MSDREEWLARTFVELADTLVEEFDLVDFLSTLSQRMVELLDASEVGLILADAGGRLRAMAASSERLHLLELFEIQNDEGPCLECYDSGEQVINVVLADADPRWPTFAPRARHDGFQTVHALPLSLRTQVIGVANVFSADAQQLSDREVSLAQSFADVATIGILQAQAIEQTGQLARQLQNALNSRVVIEQAKGVLAERLDVDMQAAFERLRTYARTNNIRLTDVARSAVDGTLTAAELRAPSSADGGRSAGLAD